MTDRSTLAPRLHGADPELLSAALTSASTAVMITDGHGVIRWVNAAFTDMSGYEPHEVVGQTPRLLKSGVQDAAFYRQLWSSIRDGRRWQGELVNRHRTGSLYTVMQSITPLLDSDGTPTHFVAVHEDVTVLRESQARVRALFDHALDAVVFFDRDGRCLDANPVACELAGRSLDDLRSTPVAELLPDEEWAQVWGRIEDGQRTGQCRIRRADGGFADVDVQVTAEVMPNVHVAICRDETVQRQLQRERHLQSQLVEATGAAVVVTDLDERVTYWNQAAESLFGWTRADVVGRPFDELRLVEIGRQIPDPSQDSDRQPWTEELEAHGRDGRTFPVLATAAPYVDDEGDLLGVIHGFADLTEVREARQFAQRRAARQSTLAMLARRALSELDLDAIFSQAVDAVAAELDVPIAGIVEVDTDGNVILRESVGIPPAVAGDGLVKVGEPSLAGPTLSVAQTVVVEDLSCETRFTPPESFVELGVVSAAATPIIGRGRHYGVLAALATTPRTFDEDDVVFLEAVAATLGSAILRMSIEEELQATAAQLARSDEIRIAFLRATSHELRTPLSAISGFAETLERRDAALEPDQRLELLSRLRTNANRLSRLIGDLLDVDRLTAGLVSANRRPHDLRRLIQRVVDEQEMAGRHLQLDLAPVVADVDPPKLERVVANLLSNAVRHTPLGGLIRIGLRSYEGQVSITVDDEGPGVDPELIEEIFQPFIQGRERHHASQPGTGLGLTLARDLTRLHGGEIIVGNRSEGGASFEVSLPEVADQAAPT